jgi:hypothetical protein
MISPYREGGALCLALRLVAAFRPHHALRRTPLGNAVADNGSPLRYQIAVGEPVVLESRARNVPEMMIKAFHILHFGLASMNLS